jgi:hypothetical protein
LSWRISLRRCQCHVRSGTQAHVPDGPEQANVRLLRLLLEALNECLQCVSAPASHRRGGRTKVSAPTSIPPSTISMDLGLSESLQPEKDTTSALDSREPSAGRETCFSLTHAKCEEYRYGRSACVWSREAEALKGSGAKGREKEGQRRTKSGARVTRLWNDRVNVNDKVDVFSGRKAHVEDRLGPHQHRLEHRGNRRTVRRQPFGNGRTMIACMSYVPIDDNSHDMNSSTHVVEDMTRRRVVARVNDCDASARQRPGRRGSLEGGRQHAPSSMPSFSSPFISFTCAMWPESMQSYFAFGLSRATSTHNGRRSYRPTLHRGQGRALRRGYSGASGARGFRWYRRSEARCRPR